MTFPLIFPITLSLAVSLSFAACTSSTAPTSINGGGIPNGTAADDSNFTYLFAGGQQRNIYRSSDKGATWSTMTIHFNPEIQANKFVVMGPYIYCASNDWVLRSTDDGLTWDTTSMAPGTWTSTIVDLIQSGTCLVACSQQVYRSSDSGRSWVVIDSGLTSPRIAIMHNSLAAIGNKVFVNSQNGSPSLFSSVDHGLTWTGIPSAPALISRSYLTAVGSTLYASGSDSGVFRSADEGQTWVPVGLRGAGLGGWLESYGNNLYTASYATNRFFRSTDNGITWDGFTSVPANHKIRRIATKGPNVFVTTDGNGLWMSRDSGVSWSSLRGNLPDSVIGAIGFK